MAISMPAFLSRFLRPFTSSTKMGLNSDAAAATTQTRDIPANAQKCTVAAGCFWGVEHAYRKQFSEKGLIDATVGYCGGDTKNPSYRAVCSGRTGHAEALQVLYNPDMVTYTQLVEFFYKMHDPTTKNRQGGDAGTQYRSAIFWHNEEQERIARDITTKVGEQWWKNGKVATELAPAGEWFDAETYHQRYLDKTPNGYECPSHYVRNFPDLK